MLWINLNTLFNLRGDAFFQVQDVSVEGHLKCAYMKTKKTYQKRQEEILFSLALSFYFPVCFLA